MDPSDDDISRVGQLADTIDDAIDASRATNEMIVAAIAAVLAGRLQDQSATLRDEICQLLVGAVVMATETSRLAHFDA